MKFRHTYLGILSGLAVLMASPATAQVIEVDPGLWYYISSVSVGPQQVIDKEYEYCLTPDMTKRTLGDLVAELQDGGTCSVSNVQHRVGHGEANMVCQNEDFGTARGNISADYTKTSYTVRANATIASQGVAISSKTTASRIGDCPPGWTPPPGISHK